MKRHLTKAKWIKQTEETTLNYVPGDVRQAKRVFDEELTPREQMQFVRELAETRAVEFCRAYKNIIDVSYGYGRKRVGKTGKRVIARKPCVTFIVKKKWQTKKEEDSYEKLPKYLFAYWTVKNERKLCAVATDVEDAEQYTAIRPQALPQKIAVQWKSKGDVATGLITCAVKRSGFDNKIFAMSCRHVFSLSLLLHPQRVIGATIHVGSSNSPQVLGKTLDIKGALQDSKNGHSFDAQLAEATDLDALRETLQGLKLSGFAETQHDIPDKYWIITSRKKIGAHGPRYLINRLIDYERVVASHKILVESQVDEPTIDGDSGSPVVSDGGMLIGMHIAGNNGNVAYMIPTWQLFNPEKYNDVANTEVWELVNP
ncbi:MAG: hypothetical protein NG747_16360 [Candidatus Brocadia sp.]|nr:hypothetical protein [Candidatus Brocadia sp.]